MAVFRIEKTRDYTVMANHHLRNTALCMILVMLPFFLFAMYEKNGQPLEVFLGHLIQNKFIRPKVRIYQTNNLYSALVRQSQLEQEVKRIAGKGRKTGKA